MATISRTGISNTNTIDAEHITRIIDALDGSEATEVVASGSFSGSFTGSYVGKFSGDGTNITGVTGEWDGSHNGNASITGSLTVDGDVLVKQYIKHSGDTDTFINFTDDDINVTVGNINFMDFTQDSVSELTINEASQNLDVRIEGEADSKLFFTDGSTSKVGIGTTSPTAKLHVSGNLNLDGPTADITASGIVSASRFVGPLYGNATTATSATTATTASHAITSSHISGDNVVGAVATATAATNVAITAETSNTNFFFHFGSATSGNDGVNVKSGQGCQYNPSTVTATFGNVQTSANGTASMANISCSNRQDWIGGLSSPANVSLTNASAGELSSSLVPGALHLCNFSTTDNDVTINFNSALPGDVYKFLFNPGMSVGTGVTFTFDATTLYGHVSTQTTFGGSNFVAYTASNVPQIVNNSVGNFYKGDYFEFTAYAAGRVYFNGRVGDANKYDFSG
jgi:hypothetical protein